MSMLTTGGAIVVSNAFGPLVRRELFSDHLKFTVQQQQDEGKARAKRLLLATLIVG